MNPGNTRNQADPSGRPARVLLVEDNPVNQKVANGMLKRLGHDVDIVDNGRDALEAVRTGDFDVVLMDIHMPVMDGYEATAAIRALPGANRDIPIIAMTAKALAGDRETCLDVGMNDYLSKPVRKDQLHEALSRWTRTPCNKTTPPEMVPKTASETVRKVVRTPGTATDGDLYDSLLINEVKELAGAQTFYELKGLLLDTACTQVDDVIRALAQGNMTQAQSTAHNMKGAAYNLGLKALGDCAYALETSISRDSHAAIDASIVQLRLLLEKYRAESDSFDA